MLYYNGTIITRYTRYTVQNLPKLNTLNLLRSHPTCESEKRVKDMFVLTLSHMAYEVLFTIWQGGQLTIPLKTTLAKVKTILGADSTLAMLCSIMYAPCCQTPICSTAGDRKLGRSAVKLISESFKRTDKQKHVLIRIDIQQY